MVEEPKKKDTITKKHNTYVHDIQIIYPVVTVNNMRKSWRENLEQYGKWLEEYNDRLQTALDNGFAMIDKEAEVAEQQLQEEIVKTDEQLFKEYKEQHLQFLEEKRKFIDEKKTRKEELDQEIRSQMEPMKKNVLEKAKQYRDALKLWTIKGENDGDK